MLLEYQIDGDTSGHTVAASPRLDAIDVNGGLGWPPTGHPVPSAASHDLGLSGGRDLGAGCIDSTRPEYGLMDEPSLDWPWFLDESGPSVYQTGDPETFWSQLEQI